MAEIDSKLLKIVALAKHGVGGERDSAIKIVRRICQEQSLEYDEVMSSEETLEWFEFKYKTVDEQHIIGQVLWKLLDRDNADGVKVHRGSKTLYVRTTPGRGVDISYAVSIYLAAYRAEKRKIQKDLEGAFVMKHSLYAPADDGDEDKPSKDPTNEEIAAAYRRAKLAEGLETVKLTKAIGDGNK